MSNVLLHGEVVYHYAFDLAYEMRREPLTSLLGHPVTSYTVDPSGRNPRHMSFYQPQMVRLPIIEGSGPRGPVALQRTLKILHLGALSITVRVPFAVERVADLIAYHDLRVAGVPLPDAIRTLAEEVRRELAPLLITPHPDLTAAVAYTTFVLTEPLALPGEPFRSEAWRVHHRRAIAGLLTREVESSRLSEQQVEETTTRWLSYYDHDLVVVDWDAALVIESPAAAERSLYIIELANLQLAELEAYDRILDQAVERTSRDAKRPTRLLLRRSLHDLRELRIDLARLRDELENITKFFGDWHLSRLYATLSERLHLRDWHHSIDGKLTIIDDLYQLAKQDVHGRWMMILEVSIVLLFIVELVVVFSGGG